MLTSLVFVMIDVRIGTADACVTASAVEVGILEMLCNSEGIVESQSILSNYSP